MFKTSIDLKLEPTECLVNELKRRHPEGMVMVALLPKKESFNKKEIQYQTHIHGSFETALYLTHCLEWDLAESHKLTGQEMENEEDENENENEEYA